MDVLTTDWNDVRVFLAQMRGMVEAGASIDRENTLRLIEMSEKLIAHIKYLQGGSAEIKKAES